MKNWNELFMSLLIDVYYKKYKAHGIIVPDDVLKHTMEYQNEFDQYSLIYK